MVGMRSVGVCGAGAMGAGIAQVAAVAGHEVLVVDPTWSALDQGRRRLVESLRGLARRGRMSDEEVILVSSRILWSQELDDLEECNLVIEAIFEDAVAKGHLFQRVEEVVGPDVIIATNTSSFSIDDLARGLAKPDRFVGMHFFNPAPVMKLVEVVAGAATRRSVVDEVVALSTSWGKTPVEAADVPGFIVNRVARPFYAEALLALADGAAPAAAIDHLFRRSAGFRMGPLELTDLIGQDVNYAVAGSVHKAYAGRTRFELQPIQAELVAAGNLGRKSGRGIYDYGDGATRDWSPPAVGRPPGDVQIGLRTASPGARPIHSSGAIVRYSRGLTASDEAASAGRPVAVLDWFEKRAGGAIGYAASDELAAGVAEGLIAATDMAAIRIVDRPGLLLTRTLAQLSNAAGDAVEDRVCDEAAVDAAMIAGANYPIGPCEWARQIGVAALCETLSNLAAATGKGMYEPSAHWRARL